MNQEEREDKAAPVEDQTDGRKPWTTPVVSESPVNELTAASPTITAVFDGGGLYS